MSIRPCSSSRVKKRAFNRKSELQMFLLISAGYIGAPKRCTNHWRLHTKLYKGAWNVSLNNSETVSYKDLRLGQIVYRLVFYSISSSWRFPLNGFHLIFCCRTVKTIYVLASLFLNETAESGQIFVTAHAQTARLKLIQNGVFTDPCSHSFAVQTFWRPNFKSHPLKILPLGWFRVNETP